MLSSQQLGLDFYESRPQTKYIDTAGHYLEVPDTIGLVVLQYTEVMQDIEYQQRHHGPHAASLASSC